MQKHARTSATRSNASQLADKREWALKPAAPSWRARLHRAIQAFLLGLVFSSVQLVAHSFDIKNYYEQHKSQSREEFLQKFPYQQYLKETAFTDFKVLQSDRHFLWEKYGDGDDFLYHLGDSFIAAYPINPNSPQDLTSKINIGEQYITTHRGLNPNTDEVYTIIGLYILSRVAQKIEGAIATGKFDTTSSDHRLIIKRLEKNKIYVSERQSTSTQILRSIKRHEYSYIYGRFWIKICENYKPTIILLVSLSVVSLIAAALIRNKAAHAPRPRIVRLSGTISICLSIILPVCLVIVLFRKNKCGAIEKPPAPRQRLSPTYKLQSERKYYPVNNGSQHALEVYKIIDSAGAEMGQAIWLNRSHVKASYFAHRNIQSKFQQFARSNRIMLATTGGFTNASYKPEGLTIEKGNIVNAVIMHDRHGIVSFEKDGGINILNLKRPSFTLPISRGAGHSPPNQNEIISNPLESLLSYSKLIHWCKTRQATLFQTQLLAYSDSLLIKNNDVTQKQLRERRILALARDTTGTNELHHVIFNIVTPQNLASISQEIFAILQQRHKKVEAVLNLDVGSYNIMYVYDEQGNALNGLRGGVDLSRATNLIVYSKIQ